MSRHTCPPSGKYDQKGYTQQAKTFDELAWKLNIPVEAFVEKVKVYNEMCDRGQDNQFGNDSGGFFAHTYPNYFTGGAAGRTATFGRIAGKAVCGVEI